MIIHRKKMMSQKMCSNCCSIIFQSYGVLTQCGFYHMNSSHSAMILNSLILQENGAGVKKFCPNCTVLRLIFQFVVQWLIFEKSATNMYGRKIIPQNMYFQEILGIFQSHQTTKQKSHYGRFPHYLRTWRYYRALLFFNQEAPEQYQYDYFSIWNNAFF